MPSSSTSPSPSLDEMEERPLPRILTSRRRRRRRTMTTTAVGAATMMLLAASAPHAVLVESYGGIGTWSSSAAATGGMRRRSGNSPLASSLRHGPCARHGLRRGTPRCTPTIPPAAARPNSHTTASVSFRRHDGSSSNCGGFQRNSFGSGGPMTSPTRLKMAETTMTKDDNSVEGDGGRADRRRRRNWFPNLRKRLRNRRLVRVAALLMVLMALIVPWLVPHAASAAAAATSGAGAGAGAAGASTAMGAATGGAAAGAAAAGAAETASAATGAAAAAVAANNGAAAAMSAPPPLRPLGSFQLLPSRAELELLLRLLVAALGGAAVGVERSSSDRPAGVRTMALVGLGACAFTLCSMYGFLSVAATAASMGANGVKVDPSRMASNVASGVGFIGAGVITNNRKSSGVYDRQSSVNGLTTAAAIWVAAAVGVASGVGMYFVSVIASLSTIVILRFGKVKKKFQKGVEEGQQQQGGMAWSTKKRRWGSRRRGAFAEHAATMGMGAPAPVGMGAPSPAPTSTVLSASSASAVDGAPAIGEDKQSTVLEKEHAVPRGELIARELETIVREEVAEAEAHTRKAKKAQELLLQSTRASSLPPFAGDNLATFVRSSSIPSTPSSPSIPPPPPPEILSETTTTTAGVIADDGKRVQAFAPKKKEDKVNEAPHSARTTSGEKPAKMSSSPSTPSAPSTLPVTSSPPSKSSSSVSVSTREKKKPAPSSAGGDGGSRVDPLLERYLWGVEDDDDTTIQLQEGEWIIKEKQKSSVSSKHDDGGQKKKNDEAEAASAEIDQDVQPMSTSDAKKSGDACNDDDDDILPSGVAHTDELARTILENTSLSSSHSVSPSLFSMEDAEELSMVRRKNKNGRRREDHRPPRHHGKDGGNGGDEGSSPPPMHGSP